ncbi:MAG: MMPL family transporter [Actinomycetota bacterium]|nr:MMPL family transporter [Actinomycetota bacterium]
MISKIFGWIGSHSEKRPGVVIIIILIITGLAVVGISRLKEEYGYEAMLPKNIESIETMKEADKIFGGLAEEQVLVSSKNVLRADLLRKVADYRQFIADKKSIWGIFLTDVTTPLDDMVYIETQATPNSLSQPKQATNQISAFAPSQSVEQLVPLLEKLRGLSDEELVSQVEKNLELSRERARALGISSMQQGISEDRTALLINAKVKPKLELNEQIRKVRVFEADTRKYFGELSGAKVYITGQSSLGKDSSDKTMKETRRLFAIAFLFIVFVLFITFGKISDVLLTLAVILISVLWVMGLSGWLGWPFTYTGTAIMPLLLGVDIAYAIHVLSRYYEERRKGNDPFKSALTSVTTVGVAVFLTAATTAFGFASFGISNMPPIQQFGALCFAGVLFSFTLAVTFLPASLVLRDRRERYRARWDERYEKRKKETKETLVDKVLVRLAIIPAHHRAAVLMVTAIILVACGLSVTRVKTEANLEQMMPQDMPSIVAMNKVNKHFGGQGIAYTLVEAKGRATILSPSSLSASVLSPSSLKAILDFENSVAMDGGKTKDGEPYFERSKMTSLADIVQKQAGGIPQSEQEIMRILLNMTTGMKSEQSNGLINPKYPNITMVTMRTPEGTQSDMENMADTLKEKAKEFERKYPDLDFRNSGIPVLMSDLLGSIVPTQWKSTVIALVLCAGIVTLIFGSLFFGIAATSVVFIGIALEIGTLALIGWPLDIMTVMISALVIGAGIDFGIHVTHRFREEWHEGEANVDEAMRKTISSVGKALLAAAVTTAGSFGIIAISNISFIRRFGAVTALSLSFALLASLLFLPSLLATHALRIQKKLKESEP